MKVAVVGAGSTYTPELVDGFARRQDELTVDELALHDIDRERLEGVLDYYTTLSWVLRDGKRAEVKALSEREAIATVCPPRRSASTRCRAAPTPASC